MISDEELVYALRNNVGVSDYSRFAAALAADRIEQLLESGKGLANAFAVVAVKREITEAKLAKAVEVLRFLDDGANAGVMTSTYGESALRSILRGTRDRARAVLAELEKTE